VNVLEAFACPKCAAAVPLSDTAGARCKHCGHALTVPQAYLAASRALAAQQQARRRLEPLWRRLTVTMGWGWLVAACVAVVLLPPALVTVDIWWVAAPRGLFDRLAFVAIPGLLPGSLLAVIVTANACTALGAAERLAARPPTRELNAPRCRGCAAELSVDRAAIAASCGYCGMDSLLSGVTLRERAREVGDELDEQVATLGDAISRLRLRRGLAALAAALVLTPLLGLAWILSGATYS